jgi:hypothetical protein
MGEEVRGRSYFAKASKDRWGEKDKRRNNDITEDKDENEKGISEALWFHCRRGGVIVYWLWQFELDRRQKAGFKGFGNDPALQTL